MKKNLLKILAVVVLILLVLLLLESNGEKDRPFTQVILNEKNAVNNFERPAFYDTIIKVGLDIMMIDGVIVNVAKLSDGAKSNFDGDLKAHVRYFNGSFYLFIDEMSREEAITVISHEIIHMKQYLDEDLIFENGSVIWRGQQFSLESVDYDNRPWEKEAFDNEGSVSEDIQKIVWP